MRRIVHILGALGLGLVVAAGCQRSRSSSTAPPPANGGGPGQSQPTITSVAPSQGPAAGGTTVTVTGSGFQASPTGLRVLVGGTDATNVTVANGAQVTADTPAGSPGTVSVSIINPDGGTATLSNGFTYTGPAPTATAVSPNQGPTAGGTGVTITGTNFTSGATVTFGSATATGVSVVNATTLTAFTPAGSAGTVSVTVTNPDGQSATLASAFTYVSASTGGVSITAVSPNRGPVAGGTAVSITGTGFASGATVTFGGSAATAVTVVGATAITCTTPAGSAGFVNVVVTNPSAGGSATAINGFEYRTPPSIAAVLPPTGSNAGGTRVVVYGGNFSSGATVTVGGATASSVSVNGAGTEVVCTTPAGTTGAADVVVTNSDGLAATSTGAFTYVAAGTDPTIADVDASAGLAAGGNTVTITGTGFVTSGTTLVWFGTLAGSNVAVQSATQLTVRPPAGTSGTRVHVHVANPGGLSVTALAAYGYDTTGTAPTFGGAGSATAVSAYAVDLRWIAATDNASLQSKLRYRIYHATTSGGQNFSAPPAFTTDAAATRYTVGGLTPGTAFYFVVRAVDEVGNEDTGTTERSATTRAWMTLGTTAPSMLSDRSLAAAAPVGDGRVVIAGGQDGAFSVAASEHFNPMTGTWTSSSTTLTAGRDTHTGTTLADGRVLAVGGRSSAQQAGAGALSSAELYDPVNDAWFSTGPLANGRFHHTATLLPSGRVLVAAGGSGTTIPAVGTAWAFAATQELYDPTAGTWSTTGNITGNRDHHTATRLADGRVLVAGGSNGGGPLGSPANNGTTAQAQASTTYDEATGSWTARGPLNRGRESHTATLLFDGRVLVAGGWEELANNSIVRLAVAEFYDPAANTWSSTGSLAAARSAHTATLLPNGWVLATGGTSDGTSARTSTEVYDPTAGAWTSTPSLGIGVFEHHAILLRTGAVLTVGGQGAGTSGSNNGTAWKSAASVTSIFAGAWHATGALPAARRRLAVTPLADGRVLAAGGDASGAQASASLYTPATGAWTGTGSLGTARAEHTVTLLPAGLVLAVGGAGTSATLASAELYDPATGAWTATAGLASARRGHTAALLGGGRVLVAGGHSGSAALATCELYDAANATWTATGSLATARDRHTATRLADGRLLVAGGDGGSPLTSCEVYDPATGTWTGTGALATARRQHAAVLLADGRVLVCGGTNGVSALGSTELWSPATGTWTAGGSLGTVRTDHGLELVPSGAVLAVGGAGGATSVESWDPATGTWSVVGALSTGRAGAGLTVLPDGRVLAAGGDASGAVASAELYDEGLGYATGWRPRIDTVAGGTSFPVALTRGASIRLTGVRLRGLSEGHGGTARGGESDAPLVTLVGPLGGGSGQVEWRGRATALPTGTQLDFTAPAATVPLPAGCYALRVIANAIPSEARIVTLP